MNRTLTHIEYLAMHHACVVIPGLGAVLCRNVPATIADDGAVIPPHRSYAFNPAITDSDGLLEQSVARATGVNYHLASMSVADDVADMLAQLHALGTLPLGRLGTLSIDEKTAVPKFVPAATDTLTPLASWLPVVTANSFGASVKRATDNRQEKILPMRYRLLRTAVAAAAAVFVAVVSSTPITLDNAQTASTALPKITSPKPAFVPGTKAPVLALTVLPEATPVDTAARMEYQRSRINAPKTAVPETTAKTVVDKGGNATRTAVRRDMTNIVGTLDADHPYCVVVASVRNADEARQVMAEAKRRFGGEYGYVTTDGRCRVYAATAATCNEAQAKAQALATRFPGAWVCAR